MRSSSAGGSAPVHSSGRPFPAREQRLTREAVGERRGDRDDLAHLPARGPVAERIALDVHDDIDRTREDAAHDVLGHVLPGHERRVDERVERLGRAVGVHGAEEAAAGVDRAGELERFGAAHFTDDDPVGPHGEDELHEISQRDLAGAVEAGRSDLVVAAVHERHGQLADLLTRADAVMRGRGEQGSQERGLARAGLTRDDDPAAELHQQAEEVGRRLVQRFSGNELVERDIADRVATQGCGEAVGDRRDRRRESRGSLQHARLDERMLRAEMAIGRREQPVDDAPVLLLRRRHREPPQPARGVEIRHPSALDEDLFDIGPRQELGERPEVGDRAHDALHHRVGRAERERQPESRIAFVVVDGAAHLTAHVFEIAVGTQPARLDARERGDANHLVRAAIVGHNRSPDANAGVGSATTSVATSRTARAKAPRRTRPPDQAASSTRRSAGTNTNDSGRTQPKISAWISPRRKALAGARFTTTWSPASGANGSTSASQATNRAMPTGEGDAMPTSTSASETTARAIPCRDRSPNDAAMSRTTGSNSHASARTTRSTSGART